MKVLLVSHSQKTGGAERCLLEAAVGLKQRGIHVKVLIPSEGPLSEELRRTSVDYLATPFPWWVYFKVKRPGALRRTRRILALLWYSIRVLKIVRKENPDVVLTNTLCVPVAAVACKILNKKHVWYIHEYGEEDHGLVFDLGFFISSKIISSTAHHVFVNSMAIREKFSRYIPEEKFAVVQYDIPKPETQASITTAIPPDKTVNFLLVGQINSNKGQLDAVQALAILSKRGYTGKLSLVGQIADKRYFESIQTFIAERGLSKNIQVIDHVADPFRVVQSFTIGLMCSQWEALGRVTVEYMKLGIPVIGADSGTTRSLICHGRNGLLYKLRDPLDLAEQVEFLLGSQTRLDAILERAKEFARTNFNSPRFVSGLTSHLQ